MLYDPIESRNKVLRKGTYSYLILSLSMFYLNIWIELLCPGWDSSEWGWDQDCAATQAQRKSYQSSGKFRDKTKIYIRIIGGKAWIQLVWTSQSIFNKSKRTQSFKSMNIILGTSIIYSQMFPPSLMFTTSFWLL